MKIKESIHDKLEQSDAPSLEPCFEECGPTLTDSELIADKSKQELEIPF